MQYTAGTQVLSDWKIIRELGEGSFGRVFEIEKTDFGITTKSALKVIRIPRSISDIKSAIAEGMDEQSVTTYFQGIVNEIVKEIAIMSSLKSHPNIVSCEDHRVIAHSASIGWDILIRMELLTPLDDFQMRCPMTEMLVRRLGMDICSALMFCQKKGLIHRDIKPGNIFVSEAGLFKLGDFGVARTAEKTTGGLSKKGTEHYMAPEVYIGRPYGASVDIYSLGLVLYKFMNGNRLPFFPPYPQPITPDSRENALISRIQGKVIPAPINATPEFAKIILKACAHDPKQRYSTAAEMLSDLQRLPALQDTGYSVPASGDESLPTMLDPTYYTTGTTYTMTQVTTPPTSPGKTRKVLVFAKGTKAEEALAVGADYVGGADMAEKIQKENWFDFDAVVASPDMMGIVGRLGPFLAPRKLMPSPRAGTLTTDVATAVKLIKAGKLDPHPPYTEPDPEPNPPSDAPKYQIVLTGSGTNTLNVISVVRRMTEMGLAEAKTLVDNVPKLLKKDISWDEAQTMAKEILIVGGSYEIALSGSPIKTPHAAQESAAKTESPQTPVPPKADAPKYQIVLTGSGTNKLNVISVVRRMTGMGLAEAKTLVDNVPKLLKKDISWDDAQAIAKDILEAGGSYEVALSGSPVKTSQAAPQSTQKSEPFRAATPPKSEPKPAFQSSSSNGSKTTAQGSPFTQQKTGTQSTTQPKQTQAPKSSPQTKQTQPPKTPPQQDAQPKQATPPKQTAAPFQTPPVQPQKPAKKKKKGCLPIILISLLILGIIGAIAEKSYQKENSTVTPPQQAQADLSTTSSDEAYITALEEAYQNMATYLISSHYMYNVPMPSFVDHAMHLNEQGFYFCQFDGTDGNHTYGDTLVVDQIEAGIEEYMAVLQPKAAILDGGENLGNMVLWRGQEDESLGVVWMWNEDTPYAEELYATTAFSDSLPLVATDLCSEDVVSPFCSLFDLDIRPGLTNLVEWIKSTGEYYTDTFAFCYTENETSTSLYLWNPSANACALSGVMMEVSTDENGVENYYFSIDYAPGSTEASVSQPQMPTGPLTTDAEFQAAWEAVWETVKYELANPDTLPFNMYQPEISVNSYAEFMLGMGCKFYDSDSTEHDEIIWRENRENSRYMHTSLEDRTQYQTHVWANNRDNPDQITMLNFTTSKYRSTEIGDPYFANGVMPDLFDLRMGDTFETLCARIGVTQEMLEWIGGEMDEYDDFSGSKDWDTMGIRLYTSIDSQTYYSLRFTDNNAATGTAREFEIVLAYTDDGYWHIDSSTFYQE